MLEIDRSGLEPSIIMVCSCLARWLIRSRGVVVSSGSSLLTFLTVSEQGFGFLVSGHQLLPNCLYPFPSPYPQCAMQMIVCQERFNDVTMLDSLDAFFPLNCAQGFDIYGFSSHTCSVVMRSTQPFNCRRTVVVEGLFP